MSKQIFPLSTVEWKNININGPQVEYLSKKLSSNIFRDKNTEILWLLHSITLCDMTSLMGDDSLSNIRRLCHKALNPLSIKTLKLLNETFNIDAKKLTAAAICVYPNQVSEVYSNIIGSRLHLASVAAGFPSGQYPLETRLMEIERCINDGADEIDVVINRTLVHQGRLQELYDELVAMRKICKGNVKIKTILEVGQLGSYKNIYQASMIAMLAGTDFVKTSTGKESSINATLSVSLVMTMSILDFFNSTGVMVGFKPAGGIRSSDDALKLMTLVYNVLGERYIDNNLFRLGCSSLMINLEKKILNIITGNNYVDDHDLTIS